MWVATWWLINIYLYVGSHLVNIYLYVGSHLVINHLLAHFRKEHLNNFLLFVYMKED